MLDHSMGLVKLSDNEIEDGMKELSGWTILNGKLHKEIEFVGFNEAWKFMTIAVVEIQKMNHHPEWFNVYSTVVVTLSTHDSGGVTKLDLEMAQEMNKKK